MHQYPIMGRILRIIFSVISLLLAPVLYLNIEVLATAQGWDGFLTKIWPDLTAALVGPAYFAIAAFAVGAALGAWTHFLTTYRDRRVTPARDREAEKLRERIHDCRKIIADFYADRDDGREVDFRSRVLTSPQYLAIRRILSENLIKKFSNAQEAQVYWGKSYNDPYAEMLLKELNEIEKKLKL